jgi:hypothetical protein
MHAYMFEGDSAVLRCCYDSYASQHSVIHGGLYMIIL